MYQKKSLLITIILLSLVWPIWTQEKTDLYGMKGSSVEDIFRKIKDSGPLYSFIERDVTFQNEGMNLVCSLVLPEKKGRCPIVITLNGFTGNRNDGIMPGTEEPFYKRLSIFLAGQGIASLRIDFRGSGESDGAYSMTSFSTQISDTIAAINFIKKELKHVVDVNSVGVLGFSQGGLVGSIVAARDKRVDSLVIWSPVVNPPICYEGLLTKEGIKQGLALQERGSITLGVYVDDQYAFDINLGKEFFLDLYRLDPLAEIKDYKNPLLVINGIHDVVVWPQPKISELLLNYHDGFEKMITMNADHSFNSYAEHETADEVFLWSAAWFIKTLKTN